MATLAGKSALILCWSRGIGAAIVRRMATYGLKVTFTMPYRIRVKKLANETGSVAVMVDSADRDAVRKDRRT